MFSIATKFIRNHEKYGSVKRIGDVLNLCRIHEIFVNSHTRVTCHMRRIILMRSKIVNCSIYALLKHLDKKNAMKPATQTITRYLPISF